MKPFAYPVLWRVDREAVHAGTLALGQRTLELDGAVHARHRASVSIPVEELIGMWHGGRGECLCGRRSLVLELRDGRSVEIASAGRASALLAVEERLASLAPAMPVD